MLIFFRRKNCPLAALDAAHLIGYRQKRAKAKLNVGFQKDMPGFHGFQASACVPVAVNDSSRIEDLRLSTMVYGVSGVLLVIFGGKNRSIGLDAAVSAARGRRQYA